MQNNDMMFLLIFLLLFAILSMFGFFIYILLKQVKMLPHQIRMSAAGYKSGVNKRTRKVEGLFYKDVQNLIMNSSPEMFEKFPLTMQAVQDDPNLAVPVATLVARHAAPAAIDAVFSALGIESETVKGITKEAVGNEDLLKTIFNALGFGKKKKEKEAKEKESQPRRNVI